MTDCKPTSATPPRPVLLRATDPAPVSVYNPGGKARAIIVCDHASARTPAALGQLGIPRARFEEHIAVDIGAARLARMLADRLDARAVLAGYSRLVIDVNRFPDHPSSVPVVSDHVVVRGNEVLSAQARAARCAEIFWPYHNQVSGLLDELQAKSPGAPGPAVLAVHTFTPHMDGAHRPWHIGILSNHDRRIANPLLAHLRTKSDLCVGDIQPYSAVNPLGFTTVTHCEGRSLPHALMEVRQDLVADRAGVTRWATILEDALRAALNLTWP